MKRITTLAVLAMLALAALSGMGSTAAASPKKQGTIVDTAVAAGQFKTLTMLLKRAGLVSTLQKPGPYTVFAPTDAAFEKVPKSTVQALLADRAKLRAVLLYHVVPGKLSAARLSRLSSVKTANAKTLRVRLVDGSVLVNGARVTKADIHASNGLIHVIDRVLVPAD